MTDHKIYMTQPVLPLAAQQQLAPKASQPAAFQQFLQREMEGIKFSRHAQQRLNDRNIQLSPQEMEKLTAGIDKMARKGGKESLLLLNNVAYVVNVPNRTVITAVDGVNMQENVFTNIDSAAIL